MHDARSATLDASAITLSTLCVIHCLALPVVTAVLPLSAVWLELQTLIMPSLMVSPPWYSPRHKGIQPSLRQTRRPSCG